MLTGASKSDIAETVFMNGLVTSIRYFGDSHARLFAAAPKAAFQDPRFNGLKIKGTATDGASIVGLGRRQSTLEMHVKVLGELNDEHTFLLNFGQVDIELGLYYRWIVKEEFIGPATFIAKLVETYAQFLGEAKQRTSRLLVKGINLSVIKCPRFGAEYVSRVITENIPDEGRRKEMLALLQRLYPSIADRNRITLDFNVALQEACAGLGLVYFDLNQELGQKGAYRGIDADTGIREEFMPAGPDHHVVDSIFVRKLHYLKALAAYRMLDSG